MSWCQCSTCGGEFSTVSLFDFHRKGEYTIPDTRRCLSEKELARKGFHKNEKGVWKYPSNPAALERLKKEGV